MLLLRVGLGEDQRDLGVVAERDPHLVAGDLPAAVDLLARVRWLAASEPVSGSVSPKQPSDSPRAQRREPVLLLLLGAPAHDRRAHQRRLHRDDGPHRRAALAPAALQRRVARLLRADRARHRLRRRQPAHAGEEGRRRLGDQRRQDVDLPGQPRQGRADLRPDRPGEEAPRARVLPRRHRPGGLPARRSTGRWACTARTPPRSALDDVFVPRRRGHRRGRRGLQDRDERAGLRALQRRRRLRRDLPGLRRRVGELRDGAQAVRPPDRVLPARAGDARRDEGQDRRGADARLARRLAEGHRAAEHDRDLDRQVLRDRGRAGAPTRRSRSTAARATSTTTRSSATSATCA